MEGLKIVFALGSILLTLIGVVTILRLAFSSNVWWGIGCILFPFVAPVFIYFKWPDTKKGFIIFSIGAALLSGIYFSEQDKLKRAVSEIKIIKITMTTSLDDTHIPVNDLDQISLNEKKVFLHVKMQVPLNVMYPFTGQIYDAGGKQVLDYTLPTIPKDSIWNTWFYHNFDKTVDPPGRWRFVFLVKGKQLAERNFEVTAAQ